MKLRDLRLAVKLFILGCVFLILSCPASAQCDEKSSKLSVFEAITDKTVRAEISNKYKEFISLYCNNDFAAIYNRLSKSYMDSIEPKSESAFVRYKSDYYSGNRAGIISFVPESVIELGDKTGRIAGIWTIQRCVTERRNNRKTKLQATFDILKQGNEFYFTDLSLIRVSLDGNTLECSTEP